jgi:ATP-binding cassette subfamily E protein 1
MPPTVKSNTADNSYSPQSLLTGMNQFLASLEITFRRDPTNFRPRVNKMHSLKDREQKCTSQQPQYTFTHSR